MKIEIDDQKRLANEIGKSVVKFLSELSKSSPKEESKTLEEELQDIVEGLMERYDFITFSDTKEIWYYKDGVYRPGGDVIIEIETEKLFSEITSHNVEEVKNHIRRRTMKDRRELNKNSHIINFKNCLLDTTTFRQYRHTPKFLSTIQLEVKYDPKVDCPKIRHFLKTTIYGPDVKKGLALVGCAITGDNGNHLADLSIGSGNNGKSVWNGLIEALFGKNNVSHVALQELDSDRFAAADLYGKLFNICGDLPIRPLKDTGIFKKIVSGDTIRAQRKHQHPFDFEPRCVMMFSTNKLPDTPDHTLGFYRRFVYLHFPNNFEGREDRQLLSKLTTEEELSGFLNLILEYRKWIQRTGKFPGLESIEKREETYNKMQNSVECFAEESIEEQIGNDVPKEDVYEAYVSYCKSNNIPKESKESFGKSFKTLGHTNARPTINGNRIYVWKDLSIVNTTPKED